MAGPPGLKVASSQQKIAPGSFDFGQTLADSCCWPCSHFRVCPLSLLPPLRPWLNSISYPPGLNLDLYPRVETVRVPGIENINVVCKRCLRGVRSQLPVLHAAEDAAEAWVGGARLCPGTRLFCSLCLLCPSGLLLWGG